MTSFITGLDMQVDEIIRLQCFKRFGHLVLIIGIIKSRRSFYIDASKSCIYSDSIDQVHRRDNRTFTDNRIHDRQWLHGRSITWAPWPNAIGRILAFCYSFQIDGMVSQQLLGFENQVIQQISRFLCFGVFCLDQQRTVGFQWNIVGRRTIQVLVSTFYHQQMAVLYTCIEMNLFVSKLFLQILDQDIGFFRCDMSCRMVLQNFSFNANQVASHSHITRLQFYPYTGCFQRATPFVHLRQMIAHHGHVGHFASRMKSIAYGYQLSCPPHAGQCIHVRGTRML